MNSAQFEISLMLGAVRSVCERNEELGTYCVALRLCLSTELTRLIKPDLDTSDKSLKLVRSFDNKVVDALERIVKEFKEAN